MMDLADYLENTAVTKTFKSKVPDATRTRDCILGVDEAGRGPVLGPMVYGICYCPLEQEDRLKSMKFADSKTLTEDQREGLFHEINKANDFIGWMIDVIAPNVISNNMLQRAKYNLNAISHDSAIGLIKAAINNGVGVKEVYVDTVGDPGKYQAKLSEIFPEIKMTVAKKADATYPIVSAASICAKVARDSVIKNWKFVENITETTETGSGYPADPTTKAFLKSQLHPVFGFSQLVRFSWSTADKILQDNAIKVEWEDFDDGDNPAAGSSSLLSFFQHTSKNKRQREDKAHIFFSERGLNRVTSW